MDEAAGVGDATRQVTLLHKQCACLHVTVTGTPGDEKGKEVEGSYRKPDHVLVGNGRVSIRGIRNTSPVLSVLHIPCWVHPECDC